MGFGLAWAENVFDLHSPCGERVADQGSMTPPGDRFGAQDRRPLLAGEIDQFFERVFEFRGLHVIGEASKGSVPPALVRGVGAGVAKAAQGFHMTIPDAPAAQEPAEGFTVELGVVPGSGNGSDVHQPLHAMGPEQPQEILEGAGGMADGENGALGRGLSLGRAPLLRLSFS